MDSEELLVIGVTVELWSRQSLRIVDNRPHLLVRTMNGENINDSIVKSIYLYNNQNVWNPMGEDRSRSESVFEILEDGVTEVTEVPGNTLHVRQIKGVTIPE